MKYGSGEVVEGLVVHSNIFLVFLKYISRLRLYRKTATINGTGFELKELIHESH